MRCIKPKDMRTNLPQLQINSCENLKSLPFQMRSLKSHKGLRIWGFPGVESFPDGDLPPNLTSLVVGRCHNLETPQFYVRIDDYDVFS